MKLDESNYYSLEADREFWSVSQYKDFAGTLGRKGCEARTMAKLQGEYTEPVTRAMLIGSYFDAYFDGTLEQFKAEHKEVFTLKHQLRAEFKRVNQMIARVKQDPLFMQFMSGEKQKILTAELFGVPWKIKMDSFVKGKCIVDLKTAINFRSIPRYRYDLQGAIYQKVAELNGFGILPFYLAVVTKEPTPNFDIFQIPDSYLDMALGDIESNMPRLIAVKNGEEEPESCGECPYCRSVKKAKVRNYAELLEN